MLADDLDRLRLMRKCGEDFVRRKDDFDRAYERSCAKVEDGQGQEQRFYRKGELANRIQGPDSSTFVGAAGVVLAEQQSGQGKTAT